VALANVHRGLDACCAACLTPDELDVTDVDEWLGELGGHRQRMGELREQLTTILSTPQDDAVYWVNLGRDENISLHAAPLHVGPCSSAAYSTTRKR